MTTIKKTILVTGGAGFIGSNFIRHTLKSRPDWRIVNLDDLTYAGNIKNFENLPEEWQARYVFVHGSIGDNDLLGTLFRDYRFDGVFHFAAESHVDRSIASPEAFIETNIMGTFRLLDVSLKMWEREERPDFRFLHVSTDEVYGSLGAEGYFTEETPYDPSSPYSASKAGSDHLAKAYHRTYGLPVVVTNCSNNYGPFQFPEKLIPLMILNIIERKSLPVYGDGRNVRDWLYVIDHCDALLRVFEKGRKGETYNVGGNSERCNIDVVYLLCDILDQRLGRRGEGAGRNLIQFVKDRPGHDRRYAIDAGKLRRELGWQPRYRFEAALEETVDWYLNHTDWVAAVRSGEYRRGSRKTTATDNTSTYTTNFSPT
jgi:dTDP-glucose 4,6-dehydratase